MPLSDARRRLLGRLRRRKSRVREGLVLVEGVRSADEALRSGAVIRWAACSPRLRTTDQGVELVRALEASDTEVGWITDDELDGLSDTEASQGALLVAVEPRYKVSQFVTPTARVLLVDGVQDPGNLGTLIRVAAGFGLEGVVALEGTVDPWSAKAVRASAGTAFRLPVAQRSWHVVRSRIKETSIPLIVADARGQDVSGAPVGTGWALAVGSEAHGVRADLTTEATVSVAVPMPGGTESLNVGVAGAILVYALWRSTPNV